ncbi:exodeoxyribonuclease V subunit gamma [Chitinophaga polysaccharea]|uniref:exodeoxyribonuclease V subunit gamma n=1 Tax=Chitinophaga polysaccharea TaxID=1293035 RepID=UPI001455A71A|nr:exodeoxyribonuclease V subunit gamma [Chitinophaga polysaccharea]NLR59673.1 exodeoxyribonuclease V subunit gamma [Chitinophaga polysaccharea]
MALFLKVSNSLNSLSSGLAQDLQDAGNSVFQPHYIITQTEGMNNWLKLQLADRLGIAANCRFLKPNDLLYQLYVLLGGPYSEVLSPQNLSWLVFKLLGQEEFMAKFPKVAAYYADQNGESDLKRMALAEKVADLFDQYQVYRPEMIQAWTYTNTPELASAGWQHWLWVKVKQLSGGALPDKTIVGNYILDTLHNTGHNKSALTSRMPVIHLFGLSIITAYHVKILHELSSYIDVHFHIINPAPGVFWFDDRNEKQLARWRQKGLNELDNNKAGNALLTGWGRIIQDSFSLFFAYDAFINGYEEIESVEPGTDTLLHKIQHDIFSAAAPSDRLPLTAQNITDGSITINACYTVAREVEVLYNYLVHLVAQRKEALSPRDIVVMVSDIDAYAPYIKAVFNNAPYTFRYTIADESYTDNDNIFNALHAILTMSEESFKSEAVVQLLDFSYIRKRFNLTDPVQIRRIIEAANIRFGINGQKKDETHFVSWQYGIQRIMYGICMSGEEEYGMGEDSFFPLDITEGSDAHDVIRFCHFAEVLMSSILDRRRPRTIVEWVAYTERVLHNMVFEPVEDIDEDYNTLVKQLTTYNALNEFMSEKVTFEVFSHSFLDTLTGSTRAGLFVNGGITFCSLIPMRSIPFKIVALMGLNYDKFPRRENKSSFNLMEENRQKGDRNVKENDKHLFLETLLSAREYLYISYLGKNAKDNADLPPSALVDELIDYIEAGTLSPETVRQRLVTLQPLQSFSRKYAGTDARLFSYLSAKTTAGKSFLNENKTASPLTFEEITLDELISFFKNPVRAYYNKVLGIRYNDNQLLLSETEIFDLNKLQQWSIKNELLPVPVPVQSTLQGSMVKKGKLPLRNMASVAIHRMEDQVVPVRNLYEACTQGATERRLPVEIMIDDSLLKGNIRVFDHTVLQISWSKRESKYLIEAYLRYLAARAAGIATDLCFISGTKKEDAFQAVAITQEEAIRRLTNIIRVFKTGFNQMVAFYPDLEITAKDLLTLDLKKFTTKLSSLVERQESPDPYIAQAYEQGFFDGEAALVSFLDIYELLITPLAILLPAYFETPDKQ